MVLQTFSVKTMARLFDVFVGWRNCSDYRRMLRLLYVGLQVCSDLLYGEGGFGVGQGCG